MMGYKTKVETIAGRQVITVFYDRKKDDYLEAKDWAHLKYGLAVTIIFEPRA